MNTIKYLRDEARVLKDSDGDIQGIIVQYFQDNFASNQQPEIELNEVLSVIQPRVTTEMNRSLAEPYRLAFEINHHLKTSTHFKGGSVAVKLDLSKAYDRVEWSFLKGGENEGRIMGVAVAERSPRVSHLLFADDTLVFCEAIETQLEEVRSILSRYEKASGQVINFQKSSMVVGGRMASSRKSQLRAILGVQLLPYHDRYLGLPVSSGRSRGTLFKVI
ncbi:UNVERIFIED_CONTAM: hypothetical protein Sradi_1557600 [Sesamum radiatum]|uniref:Reverse transcriptase domain-containing protein n=1 Tax=Sesamum radiatum TaxID=300843 RepID=A0AAW2U8N9_SESRA